MEKDMQAQARISGEQTMPPLTPQRLTARDCIRMLPILQGEIEQLKARVDVLERERGEGRPRDDHHST